MRMAPHRSTLTGELYDDGKNWISFENDIDRTAEQRAEIGSQTTSTPEVKPKLSP
jgi:hypothetical protein